MCPTNTTNTANESLKADEKLTAGISHVGLSVKDLDASFDFFEALGFNKIGEVESYPALFLSDGAVMITPWQTDEGATPFDRRKNVGLHHLAIKVPSMEALQAAYKKVLTVEGVESEFNPTALKGTPLYHAIVYEPSGNRIELTYHSA
jgi:catechol 2,3-dioxygenase-like lactoylglutathione lyase family enzyme